MTPRTTWRARSRPASPRCVGVLLAAGAGRRYGKPKVLVPGWLDAAVGALRDGGCTQVVLVLGAAEVTPPPGVTAVVAEHWQQGLSASVRAGLEQAERSGGEYAVLHVIDTPDVGAAVVARVLSRAVRAQSGLVRAYFDARPGHPVVVARQHWPALLASLSGDSGAAAFLRGRTDLVMVQCGDLADGHDIDEPHPHHPG
ncbi:molybdopterin-guanine dinucleotide biosynthesis protein MobA [Mycobacterium sp. E2462]|uniref:nucleotidyltransferase family protein n=1 Tax=Mycobacterium sp. E2462 TaxID=1834133 RepID=UPI0007FD3866|nr:nucleotidyltransferase family protein [Mycobacterium sp. E2462]OBI07134.1 molybdopterin-guanine dinucleotide biosynthesis protein MobA [Mycobacterium sp. E2462]